MYSIDAITIRRKVSAYLQEVPKPSTYFYDGYANQPDIESVAGYIRSINFDDQEASSYAYMVLRIILLDILEAYDADQSKLFFSELVANLPSHCDKSDEAGVLVMRQQVFFCVFATHGKEAAELFATASLNQLREVWPESEATPLHLVSVSVDSNLQDCVEQYRLERAERFEYRRRIKDLNRKFADSADTIDAEAEWMRIQPDWTAKEQKHDWLLTGSKILGKAGRTIEALQCKMLALDLAPPETRSSELVEAISFSVQHAQAPSIALLLAEDISDRELELSNREQDSVREIAEVFCKKWPILADSPSIVKLKATYAVS